MRKKEIFWLFGTIVFILIVNTAVFGTDGYITETTTDINLADTYFVIAKIYLVLFVAVVIFYGIYLVRMLRRTFRNITANVIFMISSLNLILIFTFLISMVNSLRERTGVGASPLDEGMGENSVVPWNVIYFSLFGIQLILILLLLLSGIKTGVNYKRTN